MTQTTSNAGSQPYMAPLRTISEAELTALYPGPPPVASDIDATLAERGSRYGKFRNHANISQDLKYVMHNTNNWDTMSNDKREALDMIVHKIGRILNGDPEYSDSWIDLAGYATLVVKNLEGQDV